MRAQVLNLVRARIVQQPICNLGIAKWKVESGCIKTAYNQRVVLWSILALTVLRT
jgi:hypothetical protein